MSTILQLICDTYGVSQQEHDALSDCSDEALEYAMRELSKSPRRLSIAAPVRWLISVATSFSLKQEQQRSFSQPRPPHIQKIFNGSFNANHSPQSSPKIDKDQRIAFLLSEIPKIETLIKEAENGREMYGGPEYGRLMLFNVKKELQELQDHTQENNHDFDTHLDSISSDKNRPAEFKQMMLKYFRNRVKGNNDA